MYVHVRDQNDNATYASTRWVPTVRHFLACEDVAGGSQQSGGESFFCPDPLPCVRRCSWWVPAVGGPVGPSSQGGESFWFSFFCLDALPCVRRCSWWVPAVRGANRFFCPDALPCVRRCSWWVPAVRGENVFFTKYGGPSGGSLLSGGENIISRVIRRHFLAATVDRAVSLPTYSPRPMEVVP